jgi:hypothetical protein
MEKLVLVAFAIVAGSLWACSPSADESANPDQEYVVPSGESATDPSDETQPATKDPSAPLEPANGDSGAPTNDGGVPAPGKDAGTPPNDGGEPPPKPEKPKPPLPV